MKWQPQKPNTKLVFILPKIPIFNQLSTLNVLKMPIEYHENTKKFGTEMPNIDFLFGIFLVYHIFGYRFTSLIRAHPSVITTRSCRRPFDASDRHVYLQPLVLLLSGLIFVRQLRPRTMHGISADLCWWLIRRMQERNTN